MNKKTIISRLIELGEQPGNIAWRNSNEGYILGIATKDGMAVWGVVPKDDNLDNDFAEFMHNKAIQQRRVS